MTTVATFCLMTAAAQAGPVNGGFESGVASWTTVGDVSTVGPSFGVTPVEGTGAALITTSSINGDANNFSGVDAVPVGALESALGLAAGSLAGGFEGSAIYQTFTAAAGDVLSLRYNFLTTEGSREDYAFLTLVGLETLATSSDASSASAAVLDPVFLDPTAETGWRTFTYTFTAAGDYTLGLGVVDLDDEFLPSALLVDDVSLRTSTNPIPEPASAAMLGVAAALGFAARAVRRRPRPAA